MIQFKKRVFSLKILDAFSGENVFVGYFHNGKNAEIVAKKRISEEDARNGVRFEITEEMLDIKIFESVADYQTSEISGFIESAKSKLSVSELDALRKYFSTESGD